MYNAMNPVSARPYSTQGYGYKKEDDESEEKTQDSLQKDDENKNQNSNKEQAKTIASGRASDVARPPRRRHIETTTPQNNNTIQPQANILNQPQTPLQKRANTPVPTKTYQNAQVPIQGAPVSKDKPAVQEPLNQGYTGHLNKPVQQPQAQQVTSPIQSKQPQQIQQQNSAPIDAPADSRPATATSNKINIAQILKDFRNTINAIGTPDILREEVEDYLQEIIANTTGEAPSINLVQTNLMNAAMILDRYISETLDKESKVVTKWLDALFLQRINYHYDDGEINKAFLVKFPESEEEKRAKAEKAQKEQLEQTEQIPDNTTPQQYEPIQETPEQQYFEPIAEKPAQQHVMQEYVVPQNIAPQKPKVEYRKPELTIIPEDNELKSLFIQAKKHAFAKNPSKAMDMFHRALVRAEQIKDGESQSKICLEMGKIYDENNYVVQALSSYNKSLKSTTDNTIKTKAHYSMAKIYDDVNQIEPALNHYFTTVSYAGESNDISTQCTSLTYIANIFSNKQDKMAFDFYDEAKLLISQTKDSKTKGFVSSNTANGYSKFNETTNALKNYADAVKNYSEISDKENLAENYKAAAELMLKLNNPAKAKVLLNKALSYSDKSKDAVLIDEINVLIKKIA